MHYLFTIIVSHHITSTNQPINKRKEMKRKEKYTSKKGLY